MTAKALTGPHIQAKGYRKGRSYYEAAAVDWLVLHTAEGATDEKNLGNYFAGTTAGSSHAGIGQDGGYASYVNYADTAWCAPPLNEEGEHLEMCGFAKWSRNEWLSGKGQKIIETTAKWIAWRCSVRKIPIRFVARPTKGTSGVTGHVQVNQVWQKSDHWDPGPGFPWDVVISKAKQYAGQSDSDQSKPPTGVTPGKVYKVKSGDTYWALAQAAYKDGSKWPKISAANGNKALMPGQEIKIPVLSSSGGGSTTAPVSGAKGSLGSWPGYGYVAHGKRNSYVKKLQLRLRNELGATKANQLNPNGATGYYGGETAAMVRYALRNHPETWNKGARTHDGLVGPTSWKVIDKL